MQCNDNYFTCLLLLQKLPKNKKSNTSGNDFEDLAEISEQMLNDVSLSDNEEERVEKKAHHDSGSRYPVRSRSMKASYREAEVPDDDHYLCKNLLNICSSFCLFSLCAFFISFLPKDMLIKNTTNALV